MVYLVPAVAEDSVLVEAPGERLDSGSDWSVLECAVQSSAGDSLRVMRDFVGPVGLLAVLILGDVGIAGLGVESLVFDVVIGVF